MLFTTKVAGASQTSKNWATQLCAMLAKCQHLAYRIFAMSLTKSEMLSVRVEPHIKAALQAAAAREMRSQVNMIEVMVVAYCRANGYPLDGVSINTLPSNKSEK
jgi:hypothetical protein